MLSFCHFGWQRGGISTNQTKGCVMEKVIVAVMALGMLASVANASLKYECNRYVGGDYKGYTYVTANNKAEAEQKAYIKFKEQLGKKVDYVKCK